MKDYMDELMNAQPTIKEYKSQQCADCVKLRKENKQFRKDNIEIMDCNERLETENKQLNRECVRLSRAYDKALEEK